MILMVLCCCSSYIFCLTLLILIDLFLSVKILLFFIRSLWFKFIYLFNFYFPCLSIYLTFNNKAFRQPYESREMRLGGIVKLIYNTVPSFQLLHHERTALCICMISWQDESPLGLSLLRTSCEVGYIKK